MFNAAVRYYCAVTNTIDPIRCSHSIPKTSIISTIIRTNVIAEIAVITVKPLSYFAPDCDSRQGFAVVCWARF